MSEQLLEVPTYEKLKCQMEKNNWDVEINRKKLENMFSHLYIIEINTLFKVILALKRIFEIVWTLFEIILFIHLNKHLDGAKNTL